MSQTTSSSADDSRPTSAEEIIEKHGRDTIEALANDGNIAAQAALDIVDETGDAE